MRLLVADCKDDDLDEVLLSILNPLPGEDAAMTSRPRAVLATLCLADEPNVSEECAQKVLAEFVMQIASPDGNGHLITPLDRAAMEVSSSTWSTSLKKLLLKEFCEQSDETRANVGGLFAMTEVANWARLGMDAPTIFTSLLEQLISGGQHERITAALTIMAAAFEQKAVLAPGLIDALMQTLDRDAAERLSGIWALLWLNGGFSEENNKNIYWQPTTNELAQIIYHLEITPEEEEDSKRFLEKLLANSLVSASGEAYKELLLPHLNSPSNMVRSIIVQALEKLGDPQSVLPLLNKLDSEPDAEVCNTIIQTLGKLGDKRAVQPLLTRLHEAGTKERITIITALGMLGGQQVIEHLLPLLADNEDGIFTATAKALAMLGCVEMISILSDTLSHPSRSRRGAAASALLTLRNKPDEKMLLSRDFDEGEPWLDHALPITEERIVRAALKLEITTEEVRARYEAIADIFHLKFEH